MSSKPLCNSLPFCDCLSLPLVSVTLRKQRSCSVYLFASSVTIIEHLLCEQLCATHGGDIHVYMCVCVCVCVCVYNEYIIHAFIIYFTSVYGSRVSGAHQKDRSTS